MRSDDDPIRDRSWIVIKFFLGLNELLTKGNHVAVPAAISFNHVRAPPSHHASSNAAKRCKQGRAQAWSPGQKATNFFRAAMINGGELCPLWDERRDGGGQR